MVTLFNNGKKAAAQAGELSLAELQSVSGGLNPQPLPPKVFSGFAAYVNPAQTASARAVGFEYGGLHVIYSR
ncbi:MAG: hypothetical protein QOJ52_4288 [Acidimicrobiaceae bacterium]|jgi:hypothetical protein|nr:hypothetical protein [Acidimicrobiaceae bacterium]